MTNRNMNHKSYRKDRKWRIVISIIAGCLLLLLYSTIFSFSAQDGEQSSSLSMYVAEKGVELVNAITDSNWTENHMLEIAGNFEKPIRKLAHFTEYAIMGILVYTLLRPWMERGKKLYLITVCWVFLSAAIDELHQFFVPGRYSNLLDVLLDTCGGCFGMICLLVAEKWWKKRRQKKVE